MSTTIGVAMLGHAFMGKAHTDAILRSSASGAKEQITYRRSDA